jgi:cellulose synthase/poly-beta-1,6-N-acetylglucosamine synthase-like glycosyltransferase
LQAFINNIGLINSILLLIFILSFLTELIYYLLIYSRAIKQSPPLTENSSKYPPVSIIICAKNEANNLESNLPAFLEQEYPEYELIVVNDCSDDDTADVLDRFSEDYRHLKVCTIKKDRKFTHGKKLALTIGIKSSTYDTLLLSDADCIPAGKTWIKHMLRNYDNSTEIVLGVGLYKKKKGFLNTIIRWETAFTAMQYISLARVGRPYMGVGRNLSYKKKLFFENRGFASHLKLESGDDDLFISEVSSVNNTATENNPAAFTYSEPETEFRDWLRQKKRHLTTGRFYQQSTKTILGLEYMARILLLLSFLILLFRFEYLIPLLIVYIIHLLIKLIINILVFKGFKEKFLFLPSILLEILIPLIYSYLHFINYIERKRSRWH